MKYKIRKKNRFKKIIAFAIQEGSLTHRRICPYRQKVDNEHIDI